MAHKAALTLIQTDDPRLVPVLIEMIGLDLATLNASTGHANAKFVAFRALGRIGGPEAEKALIALLKPDVKDKDQHYEALSALAYSSSAEARATRSPGTMPNCAGCCWPRSVNAKESVDVRLAVLTRLYYGGFASRRTNDPGAVEPMRHAFEHDADERVRALASSILVL